MPFLQSVLSDGDAGIAKSIFSSPVAGHEETAPGASDAVDMSWVKDLDTYMDNVLGLPHASPLSSSALNQDDDDVQGTITDLRDDDILMDIDDGMEVDVTHPAPRPTSIAHNDYGRQCTAQTLENECSDGEIEWIGQMATMDIMALETPPASPPPTSNQTGPHPAKVTPENGPAPDGPTTMGHSINFSIMSGMMM